MNSISVKLIFFSLIAVLFLSANCYGAFHLKTTITRPATINVSGAIASHSPINEGAKVASTKNFLVKIRHRVRDFLAGTNPEDVKTTAALLALLGVCIPIRGLHRIYYGYYAIGIIQFLGGIATIFAFIMLTSATITLPLGTLFLLLFMIAFFYWWQIIDLIHISKDKLRPKA